MMAASFLDMDALLDTGGKVMASRFAGKQGRGIASLLGVPHDTSVETKRACVERFPFLMEACDDIPELASIKVMLEQESKRCHTTAESPPESNIQSASPAHQAQEADPTSQENSQQPFIQSTQL
eukprot:m.71091 g.71091  ORF g.71091 m.71091 type:complete len:124 (-) comp13802_c1_seq4:367-738(-)